MPAIPSGNNADVPFVGENYNKSELVIFGGLPKLIYCVLLHVHGQIGPGHLSFSFLDFKFHSRHTHSRDLDDMSRGGWSRKKHQNNEGEEDTHSGTLSRVVAGNCVGFD